MKFIVGCELEEFKEYYKRNGFAGEQGTGELGITEEKIVTQDPTHLIVWRENNDIIGDAICMKLTLMSIEKEIQETERTETY